MSDAFRCDGCREFYSGSPALRVEVSGNTYTIPSQGALIDLKHHGGANDSNPVGNDRETHKWLSTQRRYAELCVSCASEILDDVMEVIG